MRTAPEDVDERDLIDSLCHGWALNVDRVEYAPLGGGSHHWLAVDGAGARHWVTVDELDRKGWLGDAPDRAFDGLRSALDTALALRRGGLEFIVAPVPALNGETVRRLGTRHAAAVYPLVEGTSYRFGERLAPAVSDRLVDLLVRLHRATPTAAAVARPANLQPAERGRLEHALANLDGAWTGGPFSERARTLVASRADSIWRLLETFDRLARDVVASGAEPVITHGEPHPANLLGAGGRLLLIDWDTVGLAPPERDLSMIGTGRVAELSRYTEASGRVVDQAALCLYRLRWQLDDIATFVELLRSTHRQTADTEKAWLDLVRTTGSWIRRSRRGADAEPPLPGASPSRRSSRRTTATSTAPPTSTGRVSSD